MKVWKGLCRNCEEIRKVYFHPFGYAICSECGEDIADPFVESK